MGKFFGTLDLQFLEFWFQFCGLEWGPSVVNLDPKAGCTCGCYNVSPPYTEVRSRWKNLNLTTN